MKNSFIVLIALVVLVVFGVVLFTGSDEPTETAQNDSANTEVSTDAADNGQGAPTQTAVAEGDGAVIVRYTSEGFRPFIVEVEQGQEVFFRNETNQALQITTERHPTAPDQPYPGFDDSPTLAGGEEWGLPLLLTGVFGYKNELNGEHLGAIVVTPQQ